LRIPPELEKSAVERVRAYRAKRSQGATQDALKSLKAAAQGTQNLQAQILQAVKAGATLGEISDSLRETFGLYQEYSGF
jgi:methylmalonyl-CoA mutase N-terminal domain/subunit